MCALELDSHNLVRPAGGNTCIRTTKKNLVRRRCTLHGLQRLSFEHLIFVGNRHCELLRLLLPTCISGTLSWGFNPRPFFEANTLGSEFPFFFLKNSELPQFSEKKKTQLRLCFLTVQVAVCGDGRPRKAQLAQSQHREAVTRRVAHTRRRIESLSTFQTKATTTNEPAEQQTALVTRGLSRYTQPKFFARCEHFTKHDLELSVSHSD